MSGANKVAVGQGEASMKVGFRTGLMQDASRSDWDGAAPRPVSWAAWYPADDEAADQWRGRFTSASKAALGGERGGC